MASAMAQRRAGAHHQKLALIAVADLCDVPEPRSAAGRVLARRQAEEGSENSTPTLRRPRRPGSWPRLADAVICLPTPGMVINRLAVSSALTDAASSLSIAPMASSSASIWPTSERSEWAVSARKRTSCENVSCANSCRPRSLHSTVGFDPEGRRSSEILQTLAKGDCSHSG